MRARLACTRIDKHKPGHVNRFSGMIGCVVSVLKITKIATAVLR